MANKWYISGVDTIWDTIGNWSNAEGGASSGDIADADGDALFSDTSSGNNCSLDSDEAAVNVYTASADTGGTDDWTGILDVSTYALTMSGEMKIASGATLKIGSSAGTGLTLVGLILPAGSATDLQLDSVINNAGILDIVNADISINNNRGIYTQTASANMTNPSWQNAWYSFIQNAGVVSTLIGNLYVSAINTSGTVILNGSFAVGSYTLSINAGANSSLTLGTNFDISGTGDVYFRIKDDLSVFNNNKIGTYSFTGMVRFGAHTGTRMFFSADFSSADVWLNSTPQGSSFKSIGGGILKGKEFQIFSNENDDITVDNSTGNLSFEFSDDINFEAGSGVRSLTYTKGSGTWKLTGTDQNIDINGQDIEPFYSDTDIGDVTILTADTWDISTLDLTASVLTVNGTLKMGVTASTGLTVDSLTFVSGSTRDLQTDSIIKNAGNLTIPNEDISTITSSGTYFQTGNGTYINTNDLNYWHYVTIDAGAILTASGGIRLTNHVSGGLTINGTLAAGSNLIHTGSSATGTMEIGVNGDITGTQALRCRMRYGITFNYLRATALSFTGRIESRLAVEGSICPIPEWNFANADLYFERDGAINTGTYRFASYTYRMTDFMIGTFDANDNIIMDCSTNNPSWIISGNYSLAGSYQTFIYNRGTGIYTFTGSGKTADFQNKTIESITTNAGSSYTFTEGFTSNNATFEGTQTFTEGKTYSVQDITGTGTLVASSGTVYITYHGHNTFTGTLTNVILKQADVSGIERYPTVVTKPNRGEVV